MQKNHHVGQSVRFRSWSRKGYAIFISLGRQVTIGCLGKGVVEVALKKQKGVLPQVTGRMTEQLETRDEEDSGTRPDAGSGLELFLLPQAVGQAACGGAEKIRLINNPVHRRHTDEVAWQLVRVPSVLCAGRKEKLC